MNIKLLALDMDGTVLNDDHVTILNKTKDAIKKALDFGIIVIPATGRSRINIPIAFKELFDIKYIVSSNGAEVFDCLKNKVIYNNFLNCDSSEKIIKILDKNNISFEVYIDGRAYAEKNIPKEAVNYNSEYEEKRSLLKFVEPVDNIREFIDKNKCSIEKINIPSLPKDMYEYMFKKLTDLGDTSLTTSMGRNIEINAKNCNKGDGLKFLCSYLNIFPENVMSIGDSGNDIEMLKFSGISVAMQNSMDKSVFEAAKFVTSSNEDGGVADAIEKYIFK